MRDWRNEPPERTTPPDQERPSVTSAHHSPSRLSARVSAPTPHVSPMLALDVLTTSVDDLRTEHLLDGDARAARLQVQLLHNRGAVGVAGVRALLTRGWQASAADLAALPDLDRAVDRMALALRRGEYIVVFGDYDADGMTSCALVTEALRVVAPSACAGASGSAPRIEPHLPTREDDGRGLNLQAVEALAAQGATLVITTDCGTANVAEVTRARELGVDVIVSDHHPPHGERAPALAVVNPLCGPNPGSSADLAGVGVAFRLIEALMLRLALPEAERQAALARLLDLVALGTVGDVVPLTEQSWALARAGLQRLRSAPRPGLRALLAVTNVEAATLTERDISFALGPRLNAASRLGNPRAALDLLLCTDTVEAERLARQLDALNTDRRARVDAMLAEARSQLAKTAGEWSGGEDGTPNTPAMIFVVGQDWPTGMLGLVASRLAEDYGVPAFALSRKGEDYRGSGRAPEGFDLGTLLEERAEWFSYYGGHRLAAGFTIPASRVDALRAYLGHAVENGTDIHNGSQPNTAAATEEVGGVRSALLRPRQAHREADEVDCVLPLFRATLANAGAVAALAPYGPQFPEPRFLCQGVRVLRSWRTGPEGHTLRVTVEEEGPGGRAEYVLYWPRQGALADEFRPLIHSSARFDLVYAIGSFRARNSGRIELSLRLISLHRAR